MDGKISIAGDEGTTPVDAANASEFAADDEFLARRSRRSRWLRLEVLVAFFAGMFTLAAIYFGAALIPESTAKLKIAHADLTKLHQQIEAQAGDVADPKKWDAFGNSLKRKLEQSTRPIAVSAHRAKMPLTSAKTALQAALRARNQADVERKLQDAGKKLDDAKQKLNL